jgi:hypothetical protein
MGFITGLEYEYVPFRLMEIEDRDLFALLCVPLITSMVLLPPPDTDKA